MGIMLGNRYCVDMLGPLETDEGQLENGKDADPCAPCGIFSICVIHVPSVYIFATTLQGREGSQFGGGVEVALSKLQQHYLIETNLPFCGCHQNT